MYPQSKQWIQHIVFFHNFVLNIIFEGAVNLLQFQWQAFFLPAAVADIRFRTPVECINVPPASLK